jgi:hypothetical protein
MMKQILVQVHQLFTIQLKFIKMVHLKVQNQQAIMHTFCVINPLHQYILQQV